MERLDFALRRYQQIVPQPQAYMDARFDHVYRELMVWLREDATGVLEDYARRPLFREQASWPIVALRPGAATTERALVDRVEGDLVSSAKALSQLTRHRLVQRAMQAAPEDESDIGATAVRVGVATLPRYTARPGSEVDVHAMLSQVEALARGQRAALVNPDDYFEPQQEWGQIESGEWLQSGEWIVSLNPEILPVGNFTLRCMLKRVRTRMELLTSVRAACLTAAHQARAQYRKDRDALDASWHDLSISIADLERAFQMGTENRLRDACIVATQAYAAFHPSPDLGWLGLPPAVVERGKSMLSAKVTELDNGHFFDRIATSLGDLRHLYEEECPEQSAKDAAVAGGGLVVDVQRHEVYWEGALLLKPLKGRSWDLLLALAKNAQLHRAADRSDVFGDKIVGRSAMSTSWERLKGELPSSLWRRVKPGTLAQTYLLELDPHLIYISTLREPTTA